MWSKDNSTSNLVLQAADASLRRLLEAVSGLGEPLHAGLNDLFDACRMVNIERERLGGTDRVMAHRLMNGFDLARLAVQRLWDNPSEGEVLSQLRKLRDTRDATERLLEAEGPGTPHFNAVKHADNRQLSNYLHRAIAHRLDQSKILATAG